MIPGLSTEANERIVAMLSSCDKLVRAILFGSRATGQWKLGSDIDIALVGDQLTSEDLLELASLFSESSLPYQVDLVILNDTLSEGLRNHITHCGLDLPLKRLNSHNKIGQSPTPL